MPTEEWLQQYESVKDKLICPVDLETYFLERIFPLGNLEVVDLCNTRVPAGTIGFGAIEVLDAGTVHFPTGEILACDPTPFDGVKGLEDGAVSYKEYPPFFQKVPAGTFPVQIAAITTIYPLVGEEIPADLPLPAAQRVVRHGQYAHIAVTLGDGDGVICCRRVPRIVKELLPAGREKRRQLPGVVQERQLRVKAVKIQYHIRRGLHTEFGHEVCVRRFKCDRILLDFHRGPPNIKSAPCSTK